jgi:hypothetical protein
MDRKNQIPEGKHTHPEEEQNGTDMNVTLSQFGELD